MLRQWARLFSSYLMLESFRIIICTVLSCAQAVGQAILKLSDAGIWTSQQNPEKDIQVTKKKGFVSLLYYVYKKKYLYVRMEIKSSKVVLSCRPNKELKIIVIIVIVAKKVNLKRFTLVFRCL